VDEEFHKLNAWCSDLDQFLETPHQVRTFVEEHINTISEKTWEMCRKNISDESSKVSNLATHLRKQISEEFMRMVERAKLSVESELHQKLLEGIQNLNVGSEMLKQLHSKTQETMEGKLRCEIAHLQQGLKAEIQRNCGEIFFGCILERMAAICTEYGATEPSNFQRCFGSHQKFGFRIAGKDFHFGTRIDDQNLH